MNTLSRLLTRLKSCPAHDDRITEKRLIETWNGFKQTSPEHGDSVTSALITGVILYDAEMYSSLLTKAEQEQLIALSNTALERYRKRTNPPNKLGKTIAAAVKETI